MATITLQGALRWRLTGQQAYAGLVTAVGLALVAVSLQSVPTDDAGSLGFLIALGALSQLLTLSLFGPSGVSLSFPFAFLGLLWFGPAAAIAINAAATLIQACYPTRRAWHKVAFDLGLLSLATSVAAAAYRVAGGQLGVDPLPEDLIHVLVPTLMAMAAYFLVNTLVVSGAVSLGTGQDILKVWLSNHRWLGFYYAALALVALAVATTFDRANQVGYLLAAPALAVPWAFAKLSMDRARELAEKRRRVGELGVLHRVSVELNNAESMEQTVAAVLSGVKGYVRPVSLSAFLLDGDSTKLRMAVKLTADGHLVDRQVSEQEMATLLAVGHSSLNPGVLPWTRAGADGTFGNPGWRAVLPLHMNGRFLGAIDLSFRFKPDLAPEDLRLLATLLEYGAVAVDRQVKSQELIDSYRRIFHTHESVRKEVSAALHGPLQTRLLVMWHRMGQMEIPQASVNSTEQASAIRAEITDLQEYVRSLSAQLHPAIVKVGLSPALRSLAGRFQEVLAVETSVDQALESPETGASVPEELRLVLYRVAAEALNNVVKHAKADQAWIRAWGEDGLVRLSVEDNGAGFQGDPAGAGIGRQIMRDYANAVGGTVEVRSVPNLGTRVTVTLPRPVTVG